jgi:hypothetical protein
MRLYAAQELERYISELVEIRVEVGLPCTEICCCGIRVGVRLTWRELGYIPIFKKRLMK